MHCRKLAGSSLGALRETPLVSVIIAVFNRERVIGKAIKSVLAQTFQDFEIVAMKRLRMRSNLLAPSLASTFFGSKRTKVRKRSGTRVCEPHGVDGYHSWTLTTNGCQEA